MDYMSMSDVWSKDLSYDQTPTGIMYGWGNTVNGELGLGGIEEEQILTPQMLRFQDAWKVEEVACGVNHTVIVTETGQVYSCGSNDYGQLGHEKPKKRPELIDALGAYVIKHAACGGQHTLAVNEWGQLYSWGSDFNGQLGLNLGSEVETTPKMIKTLATSQVIQIACGVQHSLALTNNGELYSWGGNSHGQLGIGSTALSDSKPHRIKSLIGIPIAFVACGGYHSFAVSKSGAVFGWGKNTFGQLGLNDDVDKRYPCQLKSLRSIKVKYIACGEDFSVFLTKDGGVFTCGAGMYGQLGHGSISNEIVPRKVMELMGSTVSQVVCGRRHALAFVPSRGRVYAFGIGGAGQLGTRVACNAATPQVVLGPWVSPSGTSAMEVNKHIHEDSCVIKRIFAGGDHCFASVTLQKNCIPPDDYRIFKPQTQILMVTLDNLEKFQNVPEDSSVDQDLMSYIETVFSSQACFNGSFLLDDDEHYCCTSRHHGVDIVKAAKGFTFISRVRNAVIHDLISSCVTELLMPSLVPSPPDVETLRIYLTLPFYHEFDNPKNYAELQCPFGNSLINLKMEAGKIVGIWWSKTPVDYFERLIRVYKDVVIYLLRLPEANKSPRTLVWDESMVVTLQVLSKLNKINHDEGLKVPYDTFYLQELTDNVDIRVDYVKWLTERDPSVIPGLIRRPSSKFYFCNYPFLFDAQAKTLLLQTDQALQMQSAMNEAATRAITQLLFLPISDPTVSQFLMLNVTRDNIVNDTLAQLTQCSSSDLKKPLKVKFFGEEAEDAGGVRKEFFMLLLREILDPKYGMFRNHDDSNLLWFSEDSFEDEVMYFLIGLLCGLAIYNFTIIELPFPLALYKKLLHEPVSLQDLKGLSPTTARSLQAILDYEEDDLQDVFNVNFEITQEVWGEVKVRQLKPEGSKIPVTQANKKEFVDLYVDFILNKSVEIHFQAFHQGFHKVCGGRVLELFHSHELMAVVVGNENYDWEELERNSEYKNGYTENDPTIRMFWEVFHELTLEQKKMFLLYLTGSDRIPILGMKAIKIYIQPTSDEKYLPVAHTCFNLLDLPRYRTKERLRYKLLQAIQCTQGFSLV